ncbi:MAG TPA: P1 family peptidase [Clostridia bacterium]|jgi:L-aminopeptidase/D-esterase-like protein|nr:P1 family peptidase [Clostridia bacterium]
MLDDFKIGHYTDSEGGTGLTSIICEEGAVGGVSVRGSAPATRETDLLKTEKTVSVVHAVVLSGGSAYGLEGCCGVMAYLRSVNAGVNAGKYKVPIVCGASLYDLEYKEFAFPNKDAGVIAGKEAQHNNFTRGIKGVATGATASKVLGMDYAVKTGLGIQTYSSGDLEIAVICGVNPLGDIVENGKIIAGAKDGNGEFIGAQQVFSSCCFNAFSISNTTIGCIITNAKLTKAQANILSDLAHDGLAQSISPSHTMFDGDAFFTLASQKVEVDFNMLTALIPSLVARAIRSSVNSIN